MLNLSEVRHTAAEYSTARVVGVLRKTRVTPNILTLIGLAVSGVSGAMIGLDYLLLGGALILVSGVFDLLDGPLARATGKTTKFGAVLDSTCDRLAEAAVLLGLLVLYLDHHSLWEPILVYTTLVTSVLVSYVRARAEGLGLKCEVGIFTRAERVVVLALGIIVGHWVDKAILVSLCVLTAFALVTVIQRFIHIRALTT
ncbi:MAG: CDP-alcohol phosphatidyltransferase family protein [Chloroflexi bacterium]|nr:CDP-alcohol phosphatidyltransferase family protein [Chloroflexota bacterium]